MYTPKRTKRKRKQVLRRFAKWRVCMTLLLTCFGTLLTCPHQAYAAAVDKPTMWMGATVGYGGYYKKEDWVPVSLTIHHVGPEKNGQLVVRVNQPLLANRRLSGSLQWPVQLPTDGWSQVQITLPGGVLDEGATVTCVANGKPLYTADLTGNAVSHVALVAVLAKNNQATQFLAGASTSSNPVLPVAVNPDGFPTSANVLDSLTAVVTPVSTLEQLSTAQQQALQDWVKFGGLLIVSGTGYGTNMWRSVLPLTPGNSRTVDPHALADFANSTGDSLGKALVVQASGIDGTARLWAGTNQTPLLASVSLGRGQVWQTAFSPMDPLLLGWSGDPLMWTALFRHGTETATSAIPLLFDANGALSLASVGDALAPLRVPSLPVFAIVFAIYIALIGPIAFFVLNRFRRAQLAWVLLPLVSVVTTVGIYVFGGAQRPTGLLTDGVGVLDLTGDGTAQSYGVQAFMSPYPGGLDFQMPKGTLAVPMSVQETVPSRDAVVQSGDTTNMLFRNVGRWHVRYVYAAGTDRNTGQFVTELTSAYGLLFGHVANQTPYTLDHVAIVWENHMYEIGTLKPGQVYELNPTQVTDTTEWLSDYGTYNRNLTHGIGRSLGAYLPQFVSSSTSDNSVAPQAMIIGTTTERTSELPKPVHEQDVTSDKTIVLVRQYADVNPGIGDALQ
ncbi:hypothetical protein [Alicyclobacillus dauci]|uniref:Uncharacterized protein n=1 Tax=Alicyclobacillus dauci TaxID=1475485 RepID=A0ABY6Z732_9BACL|nr:hypothetical protein [Alicyclobacillus dauci]WAH38488.1 hypothetical protein NZD86_08405 [Alicyclobacillus dauci]